MHVGDRSAAAIDAGGVLGAFTGVLVRDGYVGYEHLQAVHAWCGVHLLRGLRQISDPDPDGQLWAQAMATTLAEANRAAHKARDRGAEGLDEETLKQIRTTTWERSPAARTRTGPSASSSPPRHAP